ncbi:UbiA family prenyltransferase [Streptacidiphilus melanogenes]|uniref:UbiA family prenyltransferase n=1 Tax=Streptacidiphilus melanogenes TaxID=411235 RepID=UPI0005A70022|nr:UbiA family prenyltransferase [Streptacidiphilus melanogenes]
MRARREPLRPALTPPGLTRADLTARLRLLLALSRPPVFVLLAVYAVLGLTGTGHGEDRLLLARVLLPVAAFLVFSVAVNDLADEHVDRVNLPGDPSRPLAGGMGEGRGQGRGLRWQLTIAAAVAGVMALASAASLGWGPALTVATGLVVSAAYSLPPVRLSARGAVASLVLPACYVAVPYLVGRLAAPPTARSGGDGLLLAGLYVGFIGRILLKDFRDVLGDALFGKRTFLLRHGRVWTCRFSAVCWTAGAVLLLAGAPHRTGTLVGVTAVHLAVTLWLLHGIARDDHPRREALRISAAAIVGRGLLLALLAHESMPAVHWPGWAQSGMLLALTALTLVQAATMLRHGPRNRLALRVPTAEEAPLSPTPEPAAAATAAGSAAARP